MRLRYVEAASLLMVLFLASFSSAEERIKQVEKDKRGLVKPGEALMILYLRVADPTYKPGRYDGFEAPYAGIPIVRIRPVDSATGRPGQIRWLMSDAKWRSDSGIGWNESLLACRLKPGQYYIDSYYQITGGRSEMGFNSSTMRTTFYLSVPLDRLVQVDAGATTVLGTLDILPNGNRIEAKWRTDPPDRAAALQAFQKRYPLVSTEAASRVSLANMTYYLYEAFEDNSRKWPLDFNQKYSMTMPALSSGGRRYEVDGASHDVMLASTIELPHDTPEEMVAEMECLWKGGEEDMPFGISLGKDLDNYFMFIVNSQGRAAVMRYSAKWGLVELVPWIVGPAAYAKSRLVLRVERRRNNYIFLVNTQKIGEFSDKEALPILRIGTFVAGKQSVSYEHLLISSPTVSSQATSGH